MAQLLQIFQEFPSLFSVNPVRNTFVRHVKDGQPICQHSYWVPQQLLGKLQQGVEKMLALGVIRPFCSKWCSPMAIIFQKDGSLGKRIDFRKLRTESLLEKIGATRYWIYVRDTGKRHWKSLLNHTQLSKHQLYCFSSLWCRLDCMEHSPPYRCWWTKCVNHCSATFLDEILIFRKTLEGHLQHLSVALNRIQRSEVKLSPSRYEWEWQEIRNLSYTVWWGRECHR